MNSLDDLLRRSAPPSYAVEPELDRVTNRITRPRLRRRSITAVVVLVMALGGATAAAAGTGTLDEIVDYYLGGGGANGDDVQHNDHAWEMDITGTDGPHHCFGGIVVMHSHGPHSVEAEYLAIKQFVQDHDWTDLEPDRSLLRADQEGTADQLAITADRHMMVVAQLEGFDLSNVSTRGTAQCFPK
jgi:hypothetical protein